MVVDSDKHRRPRIPALNIKFILLFCLSFFLLFSDQKNNYVSLLRNSVAIAIHPIQSLVDFPQRFGSWINTNISSREELIQENKTSTRKLIRDLYLLACQASLKNPSIKSKEARVLRTYAKTIKETSEYYDNLFDLGEMTR
jgi:cell shape-determining protein MreC